MVMVLVPAKVESSEPLLLTFNIDLFYALLRVMGGGLLQILLLPQAETKAQTLIIGNDELAVIARNQ